MEVKFEITTLNDCDIIMMEMELSVERLCRALRCCKRSLRRKTYYAWREHSEFAMVKVWIEWVFARENNLKYYTADDVESIGMVEVLKEALEWLDCSQLYLSLDMDAIDPAYAPGLGTPEPFGLSARDVRTAVRTLAPFSMAFDIVEIAPEYDSGQTAMLGAKLMREFIASNAKSCRKA